jgi:hypothetical protein
VAVADSADPGDVLYDLKRGTEQTQLALAGDSRGRTLLGFASTRLEELESLVGDGGTALPAATSATPAEGTVSAAGPDPILVLETLRTMDEQTQQGAGWLTDRAVGTEDAGPLDELAEWAAGQAGGLAGLQDLVPDAAAEAVQGSLTLLAEVGARSDGLEAALACPAGPAVDGSDDLGPVPTACAVPEPAPPAAGDPAAEDEDEGTATPGGGTPEPTSPPLPTGPATAVPEPGGSAGGLPTPGAPTPSPGGGLVPPLPLPTGGNAPTTAPGPGGQLPLPTVGVCLPPLATIGNC